MDYRAKKRNWLPWLICVLIGLILAAGVSYWRYMVLPEEMLADHTSAVYRAISDGFFIVGFIFTAIGGLVTISTTGFFDIFGYAMRSLIVLFTPFKNPKDQITYVEYKEKKELGRKKPLYQMLVTGILLILIAGLFLFLWGE